MEGFVKTSTNYRWRGKYRCVNCKSTGYMDVRGTLPALADWPDWWGHRHGLHCANKPLTEESA